MNNFSSRFGKLVYAGIWFVILLKSASFLYGEAKSWHEKHYVPRDSVKTNNLGMSDEAYSKLISPPQLNFMKTDNLQDRVEELTEGEPVNSKIFARPDLKIFIPETFRSDTPDESSPVVTP